MTQTLIFNIIITMDEKIYTEKEIMAVLLGLTNVYQSKNRFLKIFYRPWFDALHTAALILCGELIETQETAKLAQEFLNKEE